LNFFLVLVTSIAISSLRRSKSTEPKIENSSLKTPEKSPSERIWTTKEFFGHANMDWEGTVRFFNKTKVEFNIDGPFCSYCGLRMILPNEVQIFYGDCPTGNPPWSISFGEKDRPKELEDAKREAEAVLEHMWRRERGKFDIVYEA
jgi:hypothetical protein